MKTNQQKSLLASVLVVLAVSLFAPASAFADNYSVGKSNSTVSNPPPPPPPPPPPRVHRPAAVLAVRG